MLLAPFSTAAVLALALAVSSGTNARAIRAARRDEPGTAAVTQPADVPEPKLNGVSQLFELDWATLGASVVSAKAKAETMQTLAGSARSVSRARISYGVAVRSSERA